MLHFKRYFYCLVFLLASNCTSAPIPNIDSAKMKEIFVKQVSWQLIDKVMQASAQRGVDIQNDLATIRDLPSHNSHNIFPTSPTHYAIALYASLFITSDAEWLWYNLSLKLRKNIVANILLEQINQQTSNETERKQLLASVIDDLTKITVA